MNVTTLLPILLTVIGLAGGLAGYFWKSKGDTVIQLQSKEIEYWTNKANECEKQIAILGTENGTLKQQNQKLEGLAQGSPQLVKLTTEIKKLVVEVRQIARNGQ